MEKYLPGICFYFHTISLYLELLLSGKIFPKDFGTNWQEGEWVQIGLMVRSVFRFSLEAVFSTRFLLAQDLHLGPNNIDMGLLSTDDYKQ